MPHPPNNSSLKLQTANSPLLPTPAPQSSLPWEQKVALLITTTNSTCQARATPCKNCEEDTYHPYFKDGKVEAWVKAFSPEPQVLWLQSLLTAIV